VKFIKNLTKLHSLVTLGFIPGVHKTLKKQTFWIAGINPAMTTRIVFARFLADKVQSYQDFVEKTEPCNTACQA
jgi:hypothetical protein